MAYTIEKTPRVVDFALNPFGFETDMTYRTRYFRFYFHFLIAPPIGSYLEIKWSDKVVRFDVVAAADESGTQLTSTTVLATIIADLQKNTLFASTWTANASSFRLGFYETDIFAFIPVEINFPNLDFKLYQSSLKFEDPQKLVSELFLKHLGESGFTSKGLAFHYIDYDGIALIKLTKRVLEGFKAYSPTPSDSVTHEIALTEYYLKIWEHWPNDAVSLKELTETDHYFALPGKLPFNIFPTFTFPTPIAILSNAPAWREVWKEAHQEITALITADIASFDIKAKLYFDDETDTTIDIATVNCTQNKAYYIAAGYNQLNIDASTPEGKTCYRYEVILLSESVIAASASFIVVDNPEFGKVLRFINAKGGYDAVCIIGMESKKRKVSIIEAQSSTPLFYAATDDLYQKITSDTYDEYELIISALNHDEVEHLKELLDSPFTCKLESGEFIQIVFTSDNLPLWDDSEDLFDLKLTYRYARQ